MEETSLFLARLFGIYLIVVALAVLVNKDRYKKMFKKNDISSFDLHIGGVVALLAGLLIILNHNVWTGWPMVITIIGWLATIKGALILITPALYMKFAKDMGFENALSIFGFAGLMLGTFFVYIGFFV